MKLTSLLFAGVLAILSLSIAAAKTCDVVFTSPTKAGSLQLKAGQYKMKIDGTKITFTEVNSQKSFTTEGKVENATKNFEHTQVDSTTEGTVNVVKDIEVGGSKIKVDF